MNNPSSQLEIDHLLRQADGYDRAFQFTEALGVAELAIEHFPDVPAAILTLARAYRRLGLYSKSQRVLQSVESSFGTFDPRIQKQLIEEAEQSDSWDLFESWSLSLMGSRDIGTWLLPKLARISSRSGNNRVAASLFEADERTNWRRKYFGRKVLLSYPKSGTTWLRFGISEYLRSAFGIPESHSTIDVNSILKAAKQTADFSIAHDSAAISSEAGDLLDVSRVFLENTRIRYRDSKTVLIVRDPRDIVVSYYFQLKNRTARVFNFETVDEFASHPSMGLARVIAFFALIEKVTEQPDTLTIFYEDMLENPRVALSSALDCFGYRQYGSDTNLDVAIGRSSFDMMQRLERAGQIEGMRAFRNGSSDALKVRSGTRGSHRDVLSPEVIETALRTCKRKPKRLLDRYKIFR